MRYINKAIAWSLAETVPAMHSPLYEGRKVSLRTSLRKTSTQPQRSDLSRREAVKREATSGMRGQGPMVVSFGLGSYKARRVRYQIASSQYLA